ncbi:MAG TPA: hypothetical protein VFX18_03180 [Candidatus Nitrosocosmicus sp.]|nr:hypothetical protein [Candidatus Nitrosocosmicus sp.]
MVYTLLIGNNFISNSPKKVMFYDTLLFELNESNNDGLPLISTIIYSDNNKKMIEIGENICKYCDQSLVKKRDEKNHILIMEESGKIVFEFRILDKDTILVSGIFFISENQKLDVTQNYIILPSGKWIMHDRINSNNKDIIITNEGIATSN